MATQDFISKDRTSRFVNGGRIRYNGVPVRQWGHYTAGHNCWVYQTTKFLPLHATRKDIEESFR